jgi:hypothetical protein
MTASVRAKEDPAFELVWRRIEHHAGEEFEMIRGARFLYSIDSGQLIPNRTKQRIPRSQFEKAFKIVPLESTAIIQHLRGPSFIFAVLMDRRIRLNQW